MNKKERRAMAEFLDWLFERVRCQEELDAYPKHMVVAKFIDWYWFFEDGCLKYRCQDELGAKLLELGFSKEYAKWRAST